MSNKNLTLVLYKRLIKEADKFSSYNYREYAKRRIKYEFEENKQVKDPNQLKSLIQRGEQNLELIKRQALISQLYSVEKSVIEN
jgi:LYR motif-containing protein 4